MPIIWVKQQIRQIHRQILNLQVLKMNQSELDQTKYVSFAFENIKKLITQDKAVICIYHQKLTELPCLQIGIQLERIGLTLALPVHQRKHGKTPPIMEFSRFSTGDQLKKSHYGIMVPTYVEPVHPDLVIVPMLAFNPMTLHRVGYGGGYYDRTMAAYRRDGSKTLFVGLATEDLKCHELKAQWNDQPLDYVVTEAQIY